MNGNGTTSTLKRAVEPVPRRSSLRAVLFFLVGAVAAISAAVLFKRYLDVRTAAARVPTAKVVVAAKDLAQASTLRAEDLTLVDWPVAAMPEGAVANPDELAGRVVVSVVVKGEPILKSKVASSEAGSGLAAILPEGMRAMAVRVDDVVGVAGFIHPGDSVDVIVTMAASGSQPMSKIVLQDIRVLAVGAQVAKKDERPDKNMPTTVATLLVDSEQSEKLALASTNGKILLTLRSSVDGGQIATKGITPPILLASNAGAAEPPPSQPAHKPDPTRKGGRSGVRRQPAPPPPPSAAGAETKREVEILRGDLFEKRNFDEKRANP